LLPQPIRRAIVALIGSSRFRRRKPQASKQSGIRIVVQPDLFYRLCPFPRVPFRRMQPMRADLAKWCLIAVVLVLATAGANSQEVDEAPSADDGFVVGDAYTIRAERHGIQQRFIGDLVKINDHWIVLRYVSIGRHDHDMPVLSKIPFVGRMFRSASVGRTDEYLWIPRDAATVEKRTQTADRATAQPPADDAPPQHAACSVQLVVGDKVARREGGMEAVTDDELTISMPKRVKVATAIPTTVAGLASMASSINIKGYETHYIRERLACHDILCVRVANFDPAALKPLAP